MPRERSTLGRAALVATLAAFAPACGGTIAFQGDPIKVALAEPEPEPPPVKNELVEITLDHIEIKEKVQFEIDKAEILPESFGLLDQVVSVLEENPRVKKVRVIGHTDHDGPDSYNQQLSERRAASVRKYLVEHGVTKGRLESEGRGESDPIATNDTAEGREKNRRVEFLITEQDTTKQVSKEEAAAEEGEES